jgi:hypothetical protein
MILSFFSWRDGRLWDRWFEKKICEPIHNKNA